MVELSPFFACVLIAPVLYKIHKLKIEEEKYLLRTLKTCSSERDIGFRDLGQSVVLYAI